MDGAAQGRRGQDSHSCPVAARLDGQLRGLESVGSGVSEMRIDHGPGYRVYFIRRGDRLIVILAGGTKRTQAADIARALEIAGELEG